MQMLFLLQDEIKESCRSSAKCQGYVSTFDKCSERVGSRGDDEESCEEELFDLVHCVDACVAKEIFSKLK